MTNPKSTKTSKTASPQAPAKETAPANTEQKYEALHGLTPRQQVTAIIAGGVIGGMLARTKSYETLDLHKAAETLGMCDTIVEMILHLGDPMPDAPDEQPNS